MARVKEIEIKNFRGIASLHLELQGPDGSPTDVFVLAGPNGCGKTSVLEAVLIALNRAQDCVGPSGGSAVKLGSAHGQVRVYFELKSGRGWNTATFTPDQESPSTHTTIAAPCIYFSSRRVSALVGAVPITAGRRGRRKVWSEQTRLAKLKEYLVNARGYALMGGESGSYEDLMRQLNDAWALFHPGHKDRFEVLPASEDDVTAGFDVFLTADDTRRVPLDHLSSGELELFMFAGELTVSRDEDALIIVDEPELHLDPVWHGLIVRLLRLLRGQRQVLIATHSPEIFGSVYSFERTLLVPEDDPRSHAWTRPEASPASGGVDH